MHCAPRTTVRASPPLPELGSDAVDFETVAGAAVRGWLLSGRPGAGAVLLLHGIGESHLAMLDRARFLSGAGYSVLLIDFRGHGDNGGDRSTYGALESEDARAALAFLRARMPGERVGVIGVSMGGAAALLGPGPLRVDALVLESVYPTIVDAIRDRLHAWLGPLGPALAPLVRRVLLPRDGVTDADLRPVDRIGAQRAPTYVLAGTDDEYTPLEESRRLFERANEPKEFWAVEGAGHEDLYAFAPEEYERRVGAFLARHLRVDDPGRSSAAGRLARSSLAP